MYKYNHVYGKDDSVAHNKKQQMQNAHKNCFTLTGIHNTQKSSKSSFELKKTNFRLAFFVTAHYDPNCLNICSF